MTPTCGPELVRGPARLRQAACLQCSEPVFELEPGDLAEMAVVVRDQRHAERESVGRYLGIEFADRRALALENGVQLAVTGGLRLTERRDGEGGEESIDQRVELLGLAL